MNVNDSSRTWLHARRIAASLILTAAALGGGCTQVYKVKVDAMRTPEVAPRRSYHLVPADHGLGTIDPVNARARERVARALDESGLFAASRPEWADMIVVYDISVSPLRFVAQADPTLDDAAATTVFRPDQDGGAVADCTGAQVPATALKRVVAVREKRLSLVAHECVPTASSTVSQGAQLWRVDVSIQDGSPSVETLLPVLAAALVDSVDQETTTATERMVSARAAGPAPRSQAN